MRLSGIPIFIESGLNLAISLIETIFAATLLLIKQEENKHMPMLKVGDKLQRLLTLLIPGNG